MRRMTPWIPSGTLPCGDARYLNQQRPFGRPAPLATSDPLQAFGAPARPGPAADDLHDRIRHLCGSSECLSAGYTLNTHIASLACPIAGWPLAWNDTI